MSHLGTTNVVSLLAGSSGLCVAARGLQLISTSFYGLIS